MSRRKLKILYIIPRLVTGGAEQMLAQYVRGLDRNRFEIAVASTVADGDMRPVLEAAGVRIFVGSVATAGSRLAVASQLRRFVEEFKPDIIHTHLFGGDIFGWYFVCVKKLAPHWISTRHSIETSISFIRAYIWKRILRRSDAVIAVAAKVRRHDSERFHIPSRLIEVIKNGIDTDRFADLPFPDFSRSTRQLGIVGRLEAEKGHEILLKALARLTQRPWMLHVFGSGSQSDRLTRLADRLGIAARIEWHGTVPASSAIYSAIDTVVQPSLREGLSLAIMEAMAAGRLVIASTAAAEEVVSDSRTGLVVEPTAESVAAALEFSFEEPAACRMLASAARRQAIDHFDIAGHVRVLEALYERIVKEN